MYAAIYCRKSVNTLQGESIQSQLEHCRACLRMHRSAEDARQARVYRDEGFSGAGLKRPAMQQLLRDIRGGFPAWFAIAWIASAAMSVILRH